MLIVSPSSTLVTKGLVKNWILVGQPSVGTARRLMGKNYYVVCGLTNDRDVIDVNAEWGEKVGAGSRRLPWGVATKPSRKGESGYSGKPGSGRPSAAWLRNLGHDVIPCMRRLTALRDHPDTRIAESEMPKRDRATSLSAPASLPGTGVKV